jgi:glycosyltransferase involved in cell wall biosynthesis
MRVDVVDPSAFTRPYDHALSAALARAGADVRLVTSRFAYGAAPVPVGYEVAELFYRHAAGAPGSRVRQASKLVQHVPDMLRYRRRAAAEADVVHFQWLDLQWLDWALLPDRPLVLTAHDLLPREPRPGQARAQRRLYDRVDAIVAHSDYGRHQLVDGLGIPAAKVHVIHHGAFDHLTEIEGSLPPELTPPADTPVALFFGLFRPYKGIDTLLRAWHGTDHGELWVVGMPRIPLEPLRAAAPANVRFVPRFVSDGEQTALFRRADVIVIPYKRTERLDFSGVLAAALAFGKPIVLSDVGGFGEVAATGAAVLVPPDDPVALQTALQRVMHDPDERRRLSDAAAAAAAGPYSWDTAARQTLTLYGELTR